MRFVPVLANPWRADRSALLNGVLAIGGFLLCMYAFWPGLMSIDSAAQYIQALHGTYSDQHPPLMAWIWGWTDRIVKGPGGMLVLHHSMLWIGLFTIAEAARRCGTRHSWAVITVGFLPTTLSIAGVIWKDVGMAFALVCATGLIALAAQSGKRSRRSLCALALVPLAYASMIRANAAVAVLPIAWLWVGTALRVRHCLRSVLASAIVVASLLGAQHVVERYAFETKRDRLSQLIMLFDLAGIQCDGGRSTIPVPYRSAAFDAATLCEWYDSNQVDKLFFLAGSPLRMSSDESAYEELRNEWFDAIGEDPVRYLRHHNRAYASLLGIRRASDNDRLVRQPGMQHNPWGIVFSPNALSRAIDATTDAVASAGLFSGALWLAVSVFLLVRRRVRAGVTRIEVGLAASSLLYLLHYYFLSLAPNWRFIYWSVLSAAVASTLALLGSLRHKCAP